MSVDAPEPPCFPEPCSFPEPLGVTPRGGGVDVAVFSAHAEAIVFCLFDGDREIRRVRLRGRTGPVFHDHVPDVPPGSRYGLRAHGPYRPREGHRFNPAKLLIDPYTSVLDRRLALHPAMFGTRRDDALSMDDTDSAPYMPKGIVPAAEGRAPSIPGVSISTPLIPWRDTVLYELHARGFTMRHPGVPPEARGRFAGLACPAALAHLTRLGVTSVEIMPAAAWIEERHLAALGLRNYWGYNPAALMAPDPGLAPGGWEEIRAAVATLAEAGIETILDVVLNHTGEGDAFGPTLSLRGLDNASYYRLPPDAPWAYVDDTGCGDTLALDHPATLRLAMDSLRLWATRAGLAGFRFDLATTLGRRAEGFDPAAPLLSAIAQDPVLRGLKMIAEPWDIGPGGYQAGAFPAPWGEWNDRFRDDTRRFWRGDRGAIGPLATRMAGSADVFAPPRTLSRPLSRSVNFVVAHDGFTLADLVSHTRKANAANGENNRDGTDDNLSWNTGVEGGSDDPAIREARLRDQRALLATLLLARGTPMLAMGAELGQSQGGNNNAYAQDNKTAWVDWAGAEEGLIDWTARLIRLRREHPALRAEQALTGQPRGPGLAPDVAWRDASGPLLTAGDWGKPDADTLVMVLGETDDSSGRRAVILHRGQADTPIVPPPPRPGFVWRVLADSARPGAVEADLPGDAFTAAARSVALLAEQPRPSKGRFAADTETLGLLAKAAGIAPEWWEVSGRHTVVSDDTRRALLAAMGLPATTQGEARDTLRSLAGERDHRAVPLARVTRDGPVTLALGLDDGLSRVPLTLIVEPEEGEARHIRIGAEDGMLTSRAGVDGRPVRAWMVTLPDLPYGRYRVRRDDAPDTVCALTVAPRACYLPAPLTRGERRFGIAAQLYALRRAGDQGIGDYTTLARLGQAAGAAGASLVGINPLHMLFPDQRERASPYHPSDRRFLDPIYLDTGETGLVGGGDTVAYTAVWAAKKPALKKLYAALTREQNEDFQRFIDTGGTTSRRFAIFQTIAEAQPGRVWREWEYALRSPSNIEVNSFAQRNAGRVRFHQYLQYLGDHQLAAAAKAARDAGVGFGLYRDLAVGAAPDGAEAWSRQDALARGAWVGAPPDPLAPQGQNWHLPPPLPAAMARDGYEDFAALLRANMRHAGALRIDHVLGLARLFWIPEGGSGNDGAYVSYPLEDLLGQVALESHRARCLIVGEDLGTVPEGLRPLLEEAALLSYRVLPLERDGDRFRPPATYPARAVACVTTHDLPPLAGWWEGADIAERQALGLAGPEAVAERAHDRAALGEALTEAGTLPPGETGVEAVTAAAHAFLAATACDLVLAQAEDLAGARIGVNLPGTDTERPNWRRRLPVPVETLLTTGVARSVLDAIRSGRLAREAEPGTG